MKFMQFNGCKTLVVIIFLSVLFIYCNNFYQRLTATKSNVTLEQRTENESTTTTTTKRIKRYLIFQGGGVVKLVFGTSFPIMMADKKRSLNNFYNFQIQYTPPTIPLYWWSVFNTTTFAARTSARKRSIEGLMHFDKSRTLVYEFIETLLIRSGISDNDCLLNVICDLARSPFIEDLNAREEESAHLHIEDDKENAILEDYGRNVFHKLINAIFTPAHLNADAKYLNARMAGQNGANCDETFGRCAIKEKLFGRFTQFI